MEAIDPAAVAKAKKEINKWKLDPLAFAIECLRIPEISVNHHISDQQQQLLKWTGDKVRHNYRTWNVDKLEKDLPIDDDVRNTSKKLGASVMSGKGTGKDACSAWLAIWAITCFKNCKVYVVAPNERSIRQILWPEIAKWCDATTPTGEYAFKLRDFIRVEGERIYWTACENPKFDRTIEPIIVSPQLSAEQQTAVLSGRHEKNMFFFFEEACGINDNVFSPIEDTLTSENNMAFMIFNPNRTGGYAVTSQKPHMEPFWEQFHWNAEESSIASKESAKRLEELYGRDHNKFRTNVLGLPPESNEESLIPHDWVVEAAMREIPTDDDAIKVMGVDPARFGGDESIILIRQGRKILDFRRFHGLDGAKLAEQMIEADVDYEVDRCFIDAIGVGASPYDFAKDYFRNRIQPVIVSQRADDPDRFMKLRDELWWKCREWFSEGMCDIPYENDLIDQLADIQYSDQGKIKVEGKKELKRRKGADGSPDIADALCLTFRRNDHKRQKGRVAYRKQRRGPTTSSWMSA